MLTPPPGLTDAAAAAALERGQPHAVTDDTHVAWRGLQESLNPDRWRDL